jgi:DNA-binding PadR family transcriptional regulator
MITDLLILASLKEGPRHGYEIKRDAEIALSSREGINNNQIYPALHRLQESGLIEKIPDPDSAESIGPTRVVYRITEAGRGEFVRLLSNFDAKTLEKSGEFGIRIAFLDDLEPGRRIDLLKMRRDSLLERNRYRDETARALAKESRAPRSARYIELKKRLAETELEWLEDLLRGEGEG